MKNNKIIIAGGSGFIGQSLIKYFGKENEIIILGRQSGDNTGNSYNTNQITKKDGYNAEYIKWDGKNLDPEWTDSIDGSDLVINLAGKSVNCRYHKKQKKEIIESRVNATSAIGKAIHNARNKPSLWINAASATIYKNSTDKPNDEFTGIISDLKKDNMPANFFDTLRYWKNKVIRGILHGKNSIAYKELDLDFSIQVCKTWEKIFFEQSTPGTRKIALRAAITLGEGGVMVPYFNLCKTGLGGRHGNGKQMYSWVHADDLARMIEWLFDKKDTEGIYNCAAPNPVTNDQFMSAMRKATENKWGLPAPALLLEIGAFLIRTETELMLKSRWVLPARAMKEGFEFRYPVLEKALQEIVSKTKRKKYHLF